MLVSKEIFETYRDSLATLQELKQDDELKRTLRTFDLRFRLANDININFSGEISNIRTSEVRSTYSEIYSLLEIWNTYEALLHYAKEIIYLKDNQSPYLKFKEVLNEDIDKILYNGLEELEVLYKNATSNFDSYFNRIINNECIKDKLRQNTKKISDFLTHKIPITNLSGYEILGLIYAERNMYYHNGEAARMGMNYKMRLELLKFYKKILVSFILKTAIFIISKEIEKSR